MATSSYDRWWESSARFSIWQRAAVLLLILQFIAVVCTCNVLKHMQKWIVGCFVVVCLFMCLCVCECSPAHNHCNEISLLYNKLYNKLCSIATAAAATLWAMRWKFSSFFLCCCRFSLRRSSSTSTFVFYNSDATKMLMRNRKQADCRISIRTFFFDYASDQLIVKVKWEKWLCRFISSHNNFGIFVHIYFLRHHFSRPKNLDY